VKRTPAITAASLALLFVSVPLTLGCGGSGEGAPLATSTPSVSISAVPTAVGAAPPPPTSTSAEVSATNAPQPSAPLSAVAAAPSAEAPPVELPLPEVEVKNIGMHIGGGPNDNATKAPIKRSVEPHFDAFRRCYAVIVPPETGDVSVDLRIERDGGLAKLTKFKSALKGEGFEDCVRKVFDQVDFEKPKTGATVVSYSLRFTPKKP
jgi:hypothetical protein